MFAICCVNNVESHKMFIVSLSRGGMKIRQYTPMIGELYFLGASMSIEEGRFMWWIRVSTLLGEFLVVVSY